MSIVIDGNAFSEKLRARLGHAIAGFKAEVCGAAAEADGFNPFAETVNRRAGKSELGQAIGLAGSK